jgi:hypothetical protein
LKDGNNHEIHAKVPGTGFDLNKSPQDLTCPNP